MEKTLIFSYVFFRVSARKAKKEDLAMDVQDVIQDGLGWISFEVTRVARRLPHFLDRSELHAIGLLAMVECAHRFDSSRNVQFRTYAAPRIRGAILDDLRSRDIVGRKQRQQLRDSSESFESEQHHQQDVDESVYERIWLENLQRKVQLIDNDPVSIIEIQQLYERLRRAFWQVPPREQLVIRRFYFEHQRQSAIAAELSVTEGRVRQLRCRALTSLRLQLVDALDEASNDHRVWVD